jgi:maleylpyruvate isomerase
VNESEQRQLDADVAACALSHQALLAELDGLAQTDAVAVTRASMLPDWTVGHVLTHLARNADALAGIIEGASLGEERPWYPSQEARNAAIAAGAQRPLAEQVDDIRRTVWRLEQAWATLDGAGWAGHGIAPFGKVPIVQFPWRRRREVEVHRVDLGLGYTSEHWPADYVDADLQRLRTQWLADPAHTLPADVAAASDRQQLAWLLGRACGLASPAPSL